MGMMRRSLGIRVFAAVLAPWCALVMAEPMALHECAMHSGRGVQASAAAHMHGRTPVAEHAPAHGSSHDGPARHCTCLGGCCAAAILALPGVVELSVAPVSVRAARVADTADRIALPVAGHLLPFANGPPAARV